MRRIYLISLLYSALISVSAQSLDSSTDPSSNLFVAPPSELTTYPVVITLQDDAPAEVVADRIVELMDQSDANNTYKADYDGVVLNGMAGDFSSNIIHTIQDEFPDMIKAVEPDYVMKVGQWSPYKASAPVVRQAPTGNWGQSRIVLDTWKDNQPFVFPDTAGNGIDIFHIDTGIWDGHPDFDHTRVKMEKILVPFEPPVDFNGHGTHTAGIMVGQRFGVAKKANLRSIKALNRFGQGLMSDILTAIEYATRQHLAKSNGRSIISMSINGPASVAVNNAVNAAYAAGILVVTAAGNNGADSCLFSPSSATGAYTVGAVDQTDTRPPWSNYGPCTNIYAPGYDIRSTWIPVPPQGAVPPDGWMAFPAVYLSGTSMAAPYVSGVAALMMSTLNFNDVRYVRSQLNLMSQRRIIKGLPSGSYSVNRLLNMRLLLTAYWNRKSKWISLFRHLPRKINTWEELMIAVSKVPPFKPAAAVANGGNSGIASVDEDEVASAVDEAAAFEAADAVDPASMTATAAGDLDTSFVPNVSDFKSASIDIIGAPTSATNAATDVFSAASVGGVSLTG